jgi:hypothetical protein
MTGISFSLGKPGSSLDPYRAFAMSGIKTTITDEGFSRKVSNMLNKYEATE